MTKIKIYTEEQVNELRIALKDIAQWDDSLEDDWEDAGHRAMDALRVFNQIIPIELPSDDEIENYARQSGLPHPFVSRGAKWVRNKFLEAKK